MINRVLRGKGALALFSSQHRLNEIEADNITCEGLVESFATHGRAVELGALRNGKQERFGIENVCVPREATHLVIVQISPHPEDQAILLDELCFDVFQDVFQDMYNTCGMCDGTIRFMFNGEHERWTGRVCSSALRGAFMVHLRRIHRGRNRGRKMRIIPASVKKLCDSNIIRGVKKL